MRKIYFLPLRFYSEPLVLSSVPQEGIIFATKFFFNIFYFLTFLGNNWYMGQAPISSIQKFQVNIATLVITI